MTTRPRILALMLSYCKTQREYQMTLAALESLRRNEPGCQLDLVVVETSSASDLDALSNRARFGGLCRDVYPNKPFNYNEFLQVGFAHAADTSFDAILLSNNDVIYAPTAWPCCGPRWSSSIRSVPGVPSTMSSFSAIPTNPASRGCRTSLELCGWSILFRRSVLERIAFEQLFPTDFSFWFQDNYYAHQLSRLGLRHALVRAHSPTPVRTKPSAAAAGRA